MEESWENWHLHPEMDCDDDYFANKSNMEEDEEFLRQILLQAPAFSSESESNNSLHASSTVASEEIIGNMVKSNSSNSIVSSQQGPKKPRGSSSPKAYILSFDNSTMIPATPEGKLLGSNKGSTRGTKRCSDSSSALPNKLQQVQNTESEKTRANNQGTKRARTTSQTIDHILAERKRRQELTERFIALSATIPGLSKTDKASVLRAAIDYVKQLKERVQELEKQEKKNGVEKVIVIKKPDLRGNEDTTNSGDIITTSSDHDDCSTILPEIAARALGKEVLIEIHCEKENGTELKILDHLENLHLSVNGSSVLPFGNSALSVTQAFKAWWSAYWHDISTPIEDCFQRITNVFLLQRQAPKKTKAEPIPRPTPQASPRVASAVVEVEDDDDDDVALADKLKIPKSRKRGATPTTSASQKKAKGAGESSVGNPSPAKSATQREEVQQGGKQGVDEQASNPLLQGTTPIPVEMAQAKKTSGKRSSRKSGSSSSHHSKSSTSSSPLRGSGPKDMQNPPSPAREESMPHDEVQSGEDPIIQPDQVIGVMPPPKADVLASAHSEPSPRQLQTSSQQPRLSPQRLQPDARAALISPHAKGGSASSKTAASSHTSSERLSALLVEDPLSIFQSFFDGTLDLESPPRQAEIAETAQSGGVPDASRIEAALAKLKGLVFDTGFISSVRVTPQLGQEVKELLAFLLSQQLDQIQADALVELQTLVVDIVATLDKAIAVEQSIETKKAQVTSNTNGLLPAKEEALKLTARRTLIAAELSSVDARLDELHREVARLEKQKAMLIDEGPAVNSRLNALAAECTSVMLSTSQLSKEVAAEQRMKQSLESRIAAAGVQLETFKSRI